MQLTRITEQQIPRYFKGKNHNDTYAGPAVVGDGGKSELIVREDGSMEITPDTPTLTHVAARDIILPDAKQVLSGASMQEMRKAMAASTAGSGKGMDLTRVIDSYNKNTQQVVQAIKNIPQTVVKGYSKRDLIIRYGSNYARYLNDL